MYEARKTVFLWTDKSKHFLSSKLIEAVKRVSQIWFKLIYVVIKRLFNHWRGYGGHS